MSCQNRKSAPPRTRKPLAPRTCVIWQSVGTHRGDESRVFRSLGIHQSSSDVGSCQPSHSPSLNSTVSPYFLSLAHELKRAHYSPQYTYIMAIPPLHQHKGSIPILIVKGSFFFGVGIGKSHPPRRTTTRATVSPPIRQEPDDSKQEWHQDQHNHSRH